MAVLGADGTSGDYVEVALDPPAVKRTWTTRWISCCRDSLPSCAFTLAFATRDGDVVSDDTPATLVVDPDFDTCP